MSDDFDTYVKEMIEIDKKNSQKSHLKSTIDHFKAFMNYSTTSSRAIPGEADSVWQSLLEIENKMYGDKNG